MTDTFKFLPLAEDGKLTYEFTGKLDEAIRFIERVQLKDVQLWKLFVGQFRGTPDDCDNGWRCEYWGKMMRGGCFTYYCTKDRELYDVLTDTVLDLLTVQDEQGRISTYSIENEFNGWDIWGRKYILLGLQYYYEICSDSQLKSRIVKAMCRHADYIMSRIGMKSEGKILITEATSHWKGLNSSSVLEPFVRLYNITGDLRYYDFSTYIVSCGGISGGNIFELAYEDKLCPYEYPVTKAYEMMSCFEGLLEYYRVNGVEKWRTAVVNFVKAVERSDITIIGCAGCTHELFDHSAVKQFGTLYDGIMQETCVTVTWMKICSQVLRLCGDPQLADCIETSVYNALLGSINTENVSVNGGLPFDSYSPLRAGIRGRATGGKKNIDGGRFYGCCAAIGAAGTGLIGLTSVMTAVDGVVVNLYIPGKVSTPYCELIIDTLYPHDGIINITVNGDGDFKVYLRIPHWSGHSEVDGIEVESGRYIEVIREWHKGDKISVTLDMRAKLIHACEIEGDPEAAGHCAVCKGPLVLARDARLGEDITVPVDIAADENGIVEAEFTDGVYKVPLTDGTTIKMIDYCDAGKTWDEHSKMACWLKTVKS